jgi:hypothetical protein
VALAEKGQQKLVATIFAFHAGATVVQAAADQMPIPLYEIEKN